MEVEEVSAAAVHCKISLPSSSSSSSGDAAPCQDAAAPTASTKRPKKTPTRQWAAWTHQEEENFFLALRQVGKNFEKITNRVQSKNKDQVRHYYYRIIKRMNKLLPPTLLVDAKNTKDANAAMLRWWSTLEKQSCSASKLHLKKRRLKNFIAALELQLLKDRRKKKKNVNGEGAASSISMVGISSSSKPITGSFVSDNCLSLDCQSMQKSVSGKSTNQKRNTGTCSGRTKREPSHTKTARQRCRKATAEDTDGIVTAYNKWEKAANAGVTLVAEAAEQLERAAVNGQPEHGDLCELSTQAGVRSCICPQKRKCFHCISHDVRSGGESADILNCEKPKKVFSDGMEAKGALISASLGYSHATALEPLLENAEYDNSLKIAGEKKRAVKYITNNDGLEKIKLQLFPVDEITSKALEKDGHNPHLELTLKSRKKISSVLQHLLQKWGNSSAASGDLALFPYNVKAKDLAACQKWTLNDTTLTAGDVHEILGSPSLFRLRYGWLSSHLQNLSSKMCEQQIPCLPDTMALQNSPGCLRGQLQKICSINGSRNKTKRGKSRSFISCGANSNLQPMKQRKPAEDAECANKRVKESFSVPHPCVSLSTLNASLLTPSQLTTSFGGSMSNEIADKKYLNSGSSKTGTFKSADQDQVDIMVDIISSPPSSPSGIELGNRCPENVDGGVSEFANSVSVCPSIKHEKTNELQGKNGEDEATKSNNDYVLSAMDWVDSLTNISVGDLLNEASHVEKQANNVSPSASTFAHPQEFTSYMDSFDCALAALARRVGSSVNVVNTCNTNTTSSIWEGEETRDAFAFQKNSNSARELAIKDAVDSPKIQKVDMVKEASPLGHLKDNLRQSEEKIESEEDRQVASMDLCWADSLGSLDTNFNQSATNVQDIFAGDTSISLSSLLASSLDAFQNFSFFGNDKKTATEFDASEQNVDSTTLEIPASSDSHNRRNMCNITDPEAHLLPMVGASM